MYVVPIIGAYGRDYSFKKPLLDDWKAKKDFMALSVRINGYLNIEDIPHLKLANVTHLKFWYNKGKRSFIYDIHKEDF